MGNAKRDLLAALSAEQQRYRKVMENLKDRNPARAALSTADELVGCLRRLTERATRDEVYRAFGAPGDFGYHTPIGAALSAFYQDDPMAQAGEG